MVLKRIEKVTLSLSLRRKYLNSNVSLHSPHISRSAHTSLFASFRPCLLTGSHCFSISTLSGKNKCLYLCVCGRLYYFAQCLFCCLMNSCSGNLTHQHMHIFSHYLNSISQFQNKTKPQSKSKMFGLNY